MTFPGFALITLATIATIQANSQTAEEIVAKSITFTGGAKAWKTVKTIKSSGTYNYGGVEFPFEAYSKSPNLYKYVVTFKGKSFMQAFDGKEGWRIDEFKKETNKTILKGTDAMAMANESDVELESPFIDYQKKGHRVLFDGKDSVENILCYKIKLLRKSGETETWFFSSENFQPVKKQAIAKNTELDHSPLDIFYSDYKKVEGLVIPFKIIYKAATQTVLDITIKTVELNQPVADNIFLP